VRISDEQLRRHVENVRRKAGSEVALEFERIVKKYRVACDSKNLLQIMEVGKEAKRLLELCENKTKIGQQ
jgi:hypothetical protein